MDESVKASPLDTKPEPTDFGRLNRATLSLRPVYLTLTIIASVLLGVGGYAAYVEYSRTPTGRATPPSVIPPSTPAPTSTPSSLSGTITDAQNGWKRYTNEHYGITFQYPGQYTLKENAVLADASWYYISILSPIPSRAPKDTQVHAEDLKIEWYIKAAERGTTLESFVASQKENDTSSISAEIRTKLGGADSIRIDASGMGETRAYYVVQHNFSYGVIQYPLQTERTDALDAILASLQFIAPVASTPASYTCPGTEWVDCMPGPDKPQKTECTSGFLTWAKANCPGFQGAAL